MRFFRILRDLILCQLAHVFFFFHQKTEVTVLEFIIVLGCDLLSIFIMLLILFESNILLFLVHVLCGRE